MLARRLLFLVAAMMIVTFVAAALAPRPVTDPVAPTPAPDTGGAAAPAGDVVEHTIDADSKRPETIDAFVGQTVHLTVEGKVSDGVQLEGLDLVRFMDASTPAEFELYLDDPGEFPIVLVEQERGIGTLIVESRE